MDDPVLTPRARARRDAILAAARRLFIEQGFGNTSMDSIASTANVSKQTLYRYYHNKEALFIATMQHMVIEQNMTVMFAKLRETPMEDLATLEHSLRAWARVALENVTRPGYVSLARVLIAEIPHVPSLGSLFFSVIPREGSQALKALLENAAAHGIIQVPDPEVAVQLFVGPLLLNLLSGLVQPARASQPPSSPHIDELVRLFLYGLAKTA